MLRLQGQLSNNIGACVCLCVVDATSCTAQRFFGCRLGQKEIGKKDERGKEAEREGEKENIFARACLLAFDSRRRLVEKGEEEEEEEKKNSRTKKGLSAQANCPLID